jgi:hypothetical protein
MRYAKVNFNVVQKMQGLCIMTMRNFDAFRLGCSYYSSHTKEKSSSSKKTAVYVLLLIITRRIIQFDSLKNKSVLYSFLYEEKKVKLAISNLCRHHPNSFLRINNTLDE